MGGFGSGTRAGSRKRRPVVEDFLCLRISDLKQEGFLEPGTNFNLTFSIKGTLLQTIQGKSTNDGFEVQYQYKQKHKMQKIQVTWTKCNYGGKRTWIVCGDCGCRRSYLLLGQEGIWKCRSCLNAAYLVQRMNPHLRHEFMATKLKQEKLKLKPGQSLADRPFRMKKKTHTRVLHKIIHHEIKSAKLFKDWVEETVEKVDARKII